MTDFRHSFAEAGFSSWDFKLYTNDKILLIYFDMFGSQYKGSIKLSLSFYAFSFNDKDTPFAYTDCTQKLVFLILSNNLYLSQ